MEQNNTDTNATPCLQSKTMKEANTLCLEMVSLDIARHFSDARDADSAEILIQKMFLTKKFSVLK